MNVQSGMDEAEAAPHLLFKNTPNNRTEQMDSFLQSMPPDEFSSLRPNTENPWLEGDTINIMCLHMVKELNMEDSECEGEAEDTISHKKQVLCVTCRNWFHEACIMTTQIPKYFTCHKCM